MYRRNFITNTGLLAGGTLLFSQPLLANLFKAYEFKVRMIRPNVGVFTERGGTIGFLLSKDGAVVIDTQFADTVPHMLDAIYKLDTAPVRFLLNTHHHGDHTSGNIAFKDIVEQAIAHENALVNLKAVTEKQKTVDKQFYPTTTFGKTLKLKLGSEKINGYYFGPAHTNGDAIYHFKEANVMHVGDLMFNKRHPFIDRSTGANIKNWINVLGKIQKKGNKDTIYIFGHSLNAGEESGTAADLKKFQDYLQKLLQFAESSFKSGVSKEAFIKNTAIPGVTEWSGSGIERPLTAAYEEVSTK